MNPVSWAYLLLALAIIAEVTGSTFLVKSEGFTRLWPSLAVVILLCIAFYLLSQVIKVIPLDIVYENWTGVAVVCTAIICYVVVKHPLNVRSCFLISIFISCIFVILRYSHNAADYKGR